MQNATRTMLSILLIVMLCACAGLQPAPSGDLPPVLAQDEVIRPYVTLGRIQVTRDTYGSDYTMTAEIRNWGLAALRQEAAKLGADAVILPEVTGHTVTYAILPSTEYRATGVAIKFK